VTLSAAVWLLLFVTVTEYDPAAKPAGKVATATWSVNDANSKAVWANATVGARPDGLKFWPVIVIWLLEVFTTVL
jgi:hypothetical protein